MSWQKEKKEHPWASTSTAKRIASDHAKKSREKAAATLRLRSLGKAYREREGLNSNPLQIANKDFSKLHNGYKGIATRKVI